MLRRFIAPFFVSSLVLTVLAFIGLNYDALAQSSEVNQDYFIKPVLTSDMVVVEPNYGRFYNPNREIKGDSSGQDLYLSLDNLAKDYDIKQTKMVRFERKGQMIPNLYVFVDSLNLETQIADKLPHERETLASNFKF
ncbi:MAG: hypothetical protein QNJ46_17735 [Leptolyngbyaceae cyanobacterium MO_188.B28]|nr:hypothetical protein [Leptolyngbyaceae cyanobacterium MO_188.B28]